MTHLTKRLFFVFMVFSLAFTGCQKDETEKTPDDIIELENIIIITDPVQLNKRLTLKDELVEMIPEYLGETKSSGDPVNDPKSNFAFILQAEVSAPVYGGKALMATHVAIKDSYAFVSYNIRGSEYGGGVEIFDVSSVTAPQILSLAAFLKADVNAIDFRDGKIFIVGAMENFEEYEFESPAYFQVLTVNSSMIITGIDTIIDIPSFSANGIKVTSDRIYITSGDNGGLTVFDHDYTRLQETAIFDARSVDVNGDNVFVLSGQPGTINVFDIQTGASVNEFPIGGANTPHSKSEISATNQYIFAALNEDGVRMVNTDGTIKQHIPRPATPPGELDENHVTNSVSVNKKLLFMGNGHSGITVGEMIPSLDDEVLLLGTMVFSDMQSSNFVTSRNNLVFVASGLGGLKILSIANDEGIPDDVIPTEPCSTLMEAIAAFLPEQQNAMIHSPELFEEGVSLNVILTEESPVYVVFVHEGAGWKNTLGYYAYPVDNPPLTIEDMQKYVVFPNASMEGSGGGLVPGDMVQLGDGPFPANTVIGFYLVAQGWANGQLVNGLYTHYTDTQFNPNNFQQHVLFVENGCEDLVLAFEDIRITGGDKDFNDVIFVIKDNPDQLPNTKFDYEGIVQINVVDEDDEDNDEDDNDE